MQASTSLKDAFLSVSKSTSEGASSTILNSSDENPKKKVKIAGAVCNAAASYNSKASYKNDATKTFFCVSWALWAFAQACKKITS